MNATVSNKICDKTTTNPVTSRFNQREEAKRLTAFLKAKGMDCQSHWTKRRASR